MSENYDGGPAFPRHYGTAYCGERQEQLWHGGMSLRAYLAAHAPPVPEWFKGRATKVVPPGRVYENAPVITEQPMDHLVRWRVAYADAMVAELDRKKEGGAV